MSPTSAIAPTPVSPHINVLLMGGTSLYPHCLSVANCVVVMGCSHILVFIAGQNNNGFLLSQALTVHVSRLSHKPWNKSKVIKKFQYNTCTSDVSGFCTQLKIICSVAKENLVRKSKSLGIHKCVKPANPLGVWPTWWAMVYNILLKTCEYAQYWAIKRDWIWEKQETIQPKCSAHSVSEVWDHMHLRCLFWYLFYWFLRHKCGVIYIRKHLSFHLISHGVNSEWDKTMPFLLFNFLL